MRTIRPVLSMALVCCCLGLSANLCTQAADSDTRYVTTTLRGKLTDPDKGKPLAGAKLRFVSLDDPDLNRETVTQADGAFEITGLTYSSYVIEIETADGEVIRGVNALRVGEGEKLEISLKISDRVQSQTTLENRPDRFVSAVKVEKVKWRRFWREFGIFWGAAAVAGPGLGVGLARHERAVGRRNVEPAIGSVRVRGDVDGVARSLPG